MSASDFPWLRWLRHALHRHPIALAATVAGCLTDPLAVVVTAATWKLLDPDTAKRSRRVIVLGATRDRRSVRLARTQEATKAGCHSLIWSQGSAVVGDVSRAGALTVQRRLLAGEVSRPARAYLDKSVWRGDPYTTWGLQFEEVALTGELGPLPAWCVPASGNAWVLLVHGHGGDRQRCPRPLRAIHDAGMPALVISWRNDGTVPDSNDHRYHLGDTEWRDLDIAAEWALRHGARGLVPYGYSMGGSIVDAFLRRSRRASAVRAVVLDAPVLDWAAVLDHEFHDFRLPLPITPLKLTVWLTELLLGVRLDAVNLREHPEALDAHPTLLFQGSSDPVCPADITRRLARRLGEQVTFIEVAGADHETAWNVDRQRYEKHLRSFLADVPSSAHS